MSAPFVAVNALWEYRFATNATPSNPAAVPVPGSGWLGPARGPFGNQAVLGATAPTTAWPHNQALWLRRTISLTGLAPVVLRGRVENACYVFLDGDYIGGFNPANAERTDTPEWTLVIPADLATAGNHQLAILCLDEIGAGPSSATYFSIEAAYAQPLFPFWPSVPMRETLEWVSDVQISEDGSENRTKVRVVPKQALSMDCFIPVRWHRLAANLIYGARNDQWLVPLWQFVQPIGDVAAGALDLAVPDTASVDFRAAGLALIYEGPSAYQIVGVESVASPTALRLTAPTQAFQAAQIVPLLPGFLTNAPQRDFNGRKSRVRLDYQIEDNMEIDAAAPAQYLGDDIYFEPGLLDGANLTEQIESDFRVLDNDLGAVDYYSPWTYRRPVRIHRALAQGLPDAWALRAWLHRRAGRWRPFWQPSFEADLAVISTGAIGTTLDVASDDYRRFASQRINIAVEHSGGWLARQISGAAQISAGTVRLTLSAPLGINAEAISRVSFLGLKRLAADRAEIEWFGNQVCKIAVPTLEISP